MSQKILDNIRELYGNIVSNQAMVAQRMQHAGVSPDPLVAESLAKYWDVLERLAAE